MKREFRALHIAVDFLKLIAWIVSGVIVLVGVIALFSGGSGTQGYAIGAAVTCFIVAGLTWVSGMIVPELIEVLLAIEENTRPRATERTEVAP